MVLTNESSEGTANLIFPQARAVLGRALTQTPALDRVHQDSPGSCRSAPSGLVVLEELDRGPAFMARVAWSRGVRSRGLLRVLAFVVELDEAVLAARLHGSILSTGLGC
jgi:hypothetical protein